MQRLRSVWADHGIPRKLKADLMKALVWPIATFGCEAWTLKKNDERRIEAFEMFCIRRLLRVSWIDRRTNEWCLEKLGYKRELLGRVIRRKLRFYGHIQRQANSLERDVLEGRVNGKRSRGRQKMTWQNNISAWTGMSMATARISVLDRDEWRRIIHARTSVR